MSVMTTAACADHRHKIDVPKGFGTGWTGYTWNEDLFPNHVKFLKELHDRDLQVTLNVHPADGVRAFEEPYEEMCKALGREADGLVSHCLIRLLTPAYPFRSHRQGVSRSLL